MQKLTCLCQRATLVEFVERSFLGGRVHRALQLVSVAGFLVQQRGRMRRIKFESSFGGVAIIREVVVVLRDVGEENFIAVGQSHSVVFVLFDRGP